MPRRATAEPITAISLVDEETVSLAEEAVMQVILSTLPVNTPYTRAYDALLKSAIVKQAQTILEKRLRTYRSTQSRLVRAQVNFELLIARKQPYGLTAAEVCAAYYTNKLDAALAAERVRHAEQYLAGLLFRQRAFGIV